MLVACCLLLVASSCLLLLLGHDMGRGCSSLLLALLCCKYHDLLFSIALIGFDFLVDLVAGRFILIFILGKALVSLAPMVGRQVCVHHETIPTVKSSMFDSSC